MATGKALDQLDELRAIYASLKQELAQADSSSARAAVAREMRQNLAEQVRVGKGAKEGSGVSKLGGRRDDLAAQRAKKKTAAKKRAAPRKKASSTPKKTAARKAAPRKRASKGNRSTNRGKS